MPGNRRKWKTPPGLYIAGQYFPPEGKVTYYIRLKVNHFISAPKLTPEPINVINLSAPWNHQRVLQMAPKGVQRKGKGCWRCWAGDGNGLPETLLVCRSVYRFTTSTYIVLDALPRRCQSACRRRQRLDIYVCRQIHFHKCKYMYMYIYYAHFKIICIHEPRAHVLGAHTGTHTCPWRGATICAECALKEAPSSPRAGSSSLRCALSLSLPLFLYSSSMSLPLTRSLSLSLCIL